MTRKDFGERLEAHGTQPGHGRVVSQRGTYPTQAITLTAEQRVAQPWVLKYPSGLVEEHATYEAAARAIRGWHLMNRDKHCILKLILVYGPLAKSELAHLTGK